MTTLCCKKCGSTDIFIKQNNTQIGLYCSDCGAWIKWLGKEELRLAELQIQNQSKKVSTAIDLSKVDIDDLLNEIRNRIKC
jgi:uncharacterized Zn finger protein